MKTAGAVIAVLSSLAAITLWLLPATVSVLGSDIDCGVPLASVAFPPAESGDLVAQCRRQSVVRALIGLAVAAVGVGGAAIMWVLAPRRPDVYWDGYRWVQR